MFLLLFFYKFNNNNNNKKKKKKKKKKRSNICGWYYNLFYVSFVFPFLRDEYFVARFANINNNF